MIVTPKTQGLQTLEHVRAFLEGTQRLGFETPNRKAAYDFIARELRRFGYARLSKTDKGLVCRYTQQIPDFGFSIPDDLEVFRQQRA